MTPPALVPDDFRRLGHEIVELVAAYLAGLRARPVFRPMDARERRALLEQPLGEAGGAPQGLLRGVRGGRPPPPMGHRPPPVFGLGKFPPAPNRGLPGVLAPPPEPDR